MTTTTATISLNNGVKLYFDDLIKQIIYSNFYSDYIYVDIDLFPQGEYNNLNKEITNIDKIIKNCERYILTFKIDKEEFSARSICISVQKNRIFFTSDLLISSDILMSNKENRKSIIYMKTYSTLDEKMQTQQNLAMWQYFKVPIPSYARLISVFDFDDKNAKQIDLESLPGHNHQTGCSDGLWFGACWQMYFSEIYYKYIPKSLFDDFQDCEENVILENGLRKITLYKNPNDYDLPQNRAKQWAFRFALGIDTIGHEVASGNLTQIADNLPIYITKQDCIYGHTKVTRYLDKNKKIISKPKAVYQEVKEYREDGITVVFEEIKNKNFWGKFV